MKSYEMFQHLFPIILRFLNKSTTIIGTAVKLKV